MDGLRTPFVIHALNETYKYDHDITLPLQGKINYIQSYLQKKAFTKTVLTQIGTTNKVPPTSLLS